MAPAKQKHLPEEKPSAFKHWISAAVVEKIAVSIQSIEPSFPAKEFRKIGQKLADLELKARVRLIRDELRLTLPTDYRKALKILRKSVEQGTLTGFELWPYSEFISAHGQEHLEISLETLRFLTPKFSSEFAVRPFLIRSPEETLEFLEGCARHKDSHVRRWVSEGTRPRLPWGERLSEFVKDPRPTIYFLEILKNDPELYVRKSVANHLNDITKDHPELALETLARWNKQATSSELKNIQWITRHALRTLIKAGHPLALQLIGMTGNVKITVSELALDKRIYKMKDRIAFQFSVLSKSKTVQKLAIDYVIHYVKSNGDTSPKVFKLTEVVLDAGTKYECRKNHVLRPVTTRRHYSGMHRIEIQINGKRVLSKEWKLLT